MSGPAHLSDDHAAVYDRQLRVWGLEVQKRLMGAKVLIVGAGGLAAEVAKNIVLAGVGTVSIVDEAPCSSSARPANFLITTDCAGAASVAEASAKTLQAMNPLVTVTAESGSAAAVDEGILAKHDVVFAAGWTNLHAISQLDATCRRLGKQLFAGFVRGPNSFMYANLQDHRYTIKGQDGENVIDYWPLEKALEAPLDKLTKKTHPLYLVLRACWEYEKAHGKAPAGVQDVAAVEALIQGMAAAAPPKAAPRLVCQGLAESLLVEDSELAPVSAVLGGVAANNIVRAISHVGAPLCNMFFFCLHDGMGMVEGLQ